MRDYDLCYLELSQVARLIHARDVSIEEVTAAVMNRIQDLNSVLNCFVTVLKGKALEDASSLQAELRAGAYRGPLHGIPVSLKDNVLTRGIRTTGGSPILKEWIPDRDADVVAALRSAGAIIVGKTNLQQYAYGAPHPAFGDVHNPHRFEMTCGGSSTGSAAAMAAGMGYGSIGTDTGGSIRIPAAYCGVAGLKPTYGLVSRKGVIPVSSNLDHVGPIARSVRDCALMLDAVSTRRDRDGEHGYARDLGDGIIRLRIGVMKPQDRAPLDPTVASAFSRACDDLHALGADMLEVELPDLFQAQLIMWTVSGVEAAELLRPQFREHRNEYNATLRDRLDRAAFIPATEYVHAQRVRELFRQQLNAVFKTVDVVVLPTVSVPAFKAGTDRLTIGGTEDDAPSIGSRLTALFNITGHPALAIPCHTSSESLPISIQMVAASSNEARLFQVAHTYEQLHRWNRIRPAAVEAKLLET